MANPFPPVIEQLREKPPSWRKEARRGRKRYGPRVVAQLNREIGLLRARLGEDAPPSPGASASAGTTPRALKTEDRSGRELSPSNPESELFESRPEVNEPDDDYAACELARMAAEEVRVAAEADAKAVAQRETDLRNFRRSLMAQNLWLHGWRGGW